VQPFGGACDAAGFDNGLENLQIYFTIIRYL
jgi:hypothetical protein